MIAYGLQALMILANMRNHTKMPVPSGFPESIGYQIGQCLPALLGMAMFSFFLRIPKDRSEAMRLLAFGAVVCVVTPMVA